MSPAEQARLVGLAQEYRDAHAAEVTAKEATLAACVAAERSSEAARAAWVRLRVFLDGTEGL